MQELEVIANLELGKIMQEISLNNPEEMKIALMPRGGAQQAARLRLELNKVEEICNRYANVWIDLLEKQNQGTLKREYIDLIFEKIHKITQSRKSALIHGHTARLFANAAGEIDRRMHQINASIRRDLEIRFRRQNTLSNSPSNDARNVSACSRVEDNQVLHLDPAQSGVELEPLSKTITTSTDKNKKVWVIHGRDQHNRDALFSFLRAIGLEPIEFSMARKLTRRPMPHVDEIIKAAFEHAQAVVVLLTGDDEARLRDPFLVKNDPPHEKKLTPQARANVIFEAGMSCVTHPDATIFVEIGEIRPFTDVSGRHVVKMDGSPEKRKELADRLQDAGCEVNTIGTDWMRTGHFNEYPIIKSTFDDIMPRDGQPDLHHEEIELLIAAADKGEIIKLSAAQAGPWIQVGPKHFLNEADPMFTMAYVDALESLIVRGLAKHDDGVLYRLTHSGFKVAREFKARQKDRPSSDDEYELNILNIFREIQKTNPATIVFPHEKIPELATLLDVSKEKTELLLKKLVEKNWLDADRVGYSLKNG